MQYEVSLSAILCFYPLCNISSIMCIFVSLFGSSALQFLYYFLYLL